MARLELHVVAIALTAVSAAGAFAATVRPSDDELPLPKSDGQRRYLLGRIRFE